MRQHGARRDANEAEIVAALERIGVAVFRVSQPGLPDLLCCLRGRWAPVEVKMPGERLTPAQQDTFRLAPFAIVETVPQALALFGVRL